MGVPTMSEPTRIRTITDNSFNNFNKRVTHGQHQRTSFTLSQPWRLRLRHPSKDLSSPTNLTSSHESPVPLECTRVRSSWRPFRHYVCPEARMEEEASRKRYTTSCHEWVELLAAHEREFTVIR